MEDITMGKKEEKIMADIQKLETKLASLRAKLPTQEPDAKERMRAEIQQKMKEDEQRREAEAKRAKVMAQFDKGIASNERTAAEAFTEAKKALQAGDTKVSDEYARLYAISRKLAADLKVRRAQYQVARGVRDQVALAVAIQAATNADVQSLGMTDPIDFLAKNKELNAQMAEQQKMWDAVMDQLGEDTEQLSSSVDADLLKDAKQEIATAVELERADELAKGAKIPGTTKTSFSGKAMLDALKKENTED